MKDLGEGKRATRVCCNVVAMVAREPADVVLLFDDMFGDGEPQLLLQSLVAHGHARNTPCQLHVHLGGVAHEYA